MSKDPDQSFETAIENLLSVIEYVLKRNQSFLGRDELYRLLIEVYEHIPEPDDPRSMGWVGDDGLP